MADTNNAQETKKEADNQNEVEDERSTENQNGQNINRARRRLDFGNENVPRENEVNDFICLSAEDMHAQRQKAIEKWNFDFENEVPLDGTWVWEKIPVQPAQTTEVISSMEKKHAENRTV